MCMFANQSVKVQRSSYFVIGKGLISRSSVRCSSVGRLNKKAQQPWLHMSSIIKAEVATGKTCRTMEIHNCSHTGQQDERKACFMGLLLEIRREVREPFTMELLELIIRDGPRGEAILMQNHAHIPYRQWSTDSELSQEAACIVRFLAGSHSNTASSRNAKYGATIP
ncbi:hypothetical protein TIFTF001_054501 [Ficus carica]|uniref:Uncharacterized protein n=1 Tax=Ficus carica TaxID=3494 RepID=A0AA88EHI4_FICCA|nr:hypothetical protein TIFTF001_054501 [Ficus carica]